MDNQKLLLAALISCSLCATVSAKETIECVNISSSTSQCNPYGHKFLKAKEIKYNVGREKAIVKKILPVPKKRVPKSKQLIYKYGDIEGSLRYKASNRNISPLEIEKETIDNVGQYVIERNDTLLKIADKFNVHISDILSLNKLRPDSSVAEGQKINIPCEQCKIDNIKKAEYTVQSGDRLSFIAADFDLTVDAILKANKLSKSSTIRVGQKLTLPLPGRLAGNKKIPILIPKKSEIIVSRPDVAEEKKETALAMLEKEKELVVEKEEIKKVAIVEPIVKKIDTEKRAQKEAIKEAKKEAKKEEAAKKEAIKEALAQKEALAEKEALAKREALAKKIAQAKKKRVLAKKEASAKKKKAKAKLALLEKKKKRKKLKTIRNLSKRKLRVTATAYSSHAKQTDSTPFLAAWNNRIRPGMKIIAVSRDMLTRYGLRNGSKVRIGGLSGYYTVRDKMNKRFKKRIDIYMGIDRRKALKWGRRSVILYW